MLCISNRPKWTFEMTTKSKTFCVKFNNHCKKITNPNESKIREAFKIDHSKVIFAQYYDRYFSNYIDIEWCEIMDVDSNELKILEEIYCSQPQSISESHHLSTSDTVVIDKFDSSTDSKFFGFSQNEISLQIQILDDIDVKKEVCAIEGTEEMDGCNIQSIPINETSPKKILLSPKIGISPQKKPKLAYEFHATSYKLPVIPESSKLGLALQKKKPLTKGLKSRFLTKIYESFSSKKKFYVEHGYKEIVHAILNTYPYLGGGLPFESAKHLWHKSLNAKFCNERKRADYDDAHLKKMQIKKKSLNIVAGGSSSMFRIPNYHPSDILCGEEDQFSVDSHKKWMSLEFKSANRNLAGITSRMKITFMDRQNLLFTDDHGAATNCLAENILKEYPCLGLEDQAIGEIRRMVDGIEEKYDNYVKRFVLFSQKLNEAVCNSRSKYKSYINELFCIGNIRNFENFVMLKCLGNLSILLLENPAHIITKSLNETHAPMLNVTTDEQVNITIDGTVFIHGVSPKNSAFLWLAAFFIFNIRPVSNKRTYDVLQHLIFNMPEKPKLNQVAIKVAQMWNDSDTSLNAQ